jgi:hypothetical protein
MEISAKVKKWGESKWSNKTIILPDFCAPYFEKYTLELVEYHKQSCLGIYFQTKEQPDVDVVSYTVHRPELQQCIAQGFKEAFQMIDALTVAEPIKPEVPNEESGSSVV